MMANLPAKEKPQPAEADRGRESVVDLLLREEPAADDCKPGQAKT